MTRLYYFLLLLFCSNYSNSVLAQDNSVSKVLSSLEFGMPLSTIESKLGREHTVGPDIWLSDCRGKMGSGWMATYSKLGVDFLFHQDINQDNSLALSLVAYYINPITYKEPIKGIDLKKLKTIQDVIDKNGLPINPNMSPALYLTMDHKVRIAYPVKGMAGWAITPPLPFESFKNKYINEKDLPRIVAVKNQKGTTAYIASYCAQGIEDGTFGNFVKEFRNVPIELIQINIEMKVIELKEAVTK